MTETRKPGRPRKYPRGRCVVGVRFTPQLYTELRAEAELHGRSLSEQVEHMVEQNRLLRELVEALRKRPTGFSPPDAPFWDLTRPPDAWT